MEINRLRFIPLFIVLLIVLPNLAPAIEVIDVEFPNKTQYSFTVTWGYRLNGYNSSQLQGFALTVSDVFDFERNQVNVARNQSSYTFTTNIESGSTYHVCVTPEITNVVGNRTCKFVTTYYDPWNLRGQIACYIGIAIFVLFVALIAYDMRYPRSPSEGGSQPIQKARGTQNNNNDLTRSNIELTSNMY